MRLYLPIRRSAPLLPLLGIQGISGVWTNVTPASVSLNPDFGGTASNFGVQQIAVDPVRQQDLYTVVDNQGVWKSTDYGATWLKISNTNLRWVMAINPDNTRTPGTPPTLWSSAGSFAGGVAKSTDGGLTWAYTFPANAQAIASGGAGWGDDVYQVLVNPLNKNHLLATFHGMPGLSQSLDGGATWSDITCNAGQGVSLYAFFTNPSPSEISGGATASTTILTVSQWATGEGTWRTTTTGATWAKSTTVQHTHGNAQIVTRAGGEVFVPGIKGDTSATGVWRSTDYGVTFALVNDGTNQNGLIATPNFTYADMGWATQGTQGQTPQRAAVGNGAAWTNYASWAATNGSVQAAVTTDGSRYAIVSGCRLAGLWRYIE